ncbi:protein SIEVE ELEMENT OCCLUSION B-like isoform X3 [Eucalyptus grandis]|uniref:protein SIEVE ELEMENT OCCLUSION B-like isoform X3 n=1 Tax=Eucalyptus grandis TaxID=71139 RepID=UPI00192E9D1D|nr:protein SIEVE ELEMENT OCCLUSION B-like isoform X3 [Eucalyptus grandis]
MSCAEEVKSKCPRITHADLYQLAGVVAVEVTGGPTIDFVPRRKTPEGDSVTIIPINISHMISWICYQMTGEALGGKNLGDSLPVIFQKLSSCRWTTQVLVVLAAFALHYGNFWYISEAPCDGINAMSTCLLKGLSSLKKNLISDENKKAINRVVRDLLELTTSLDGLVKLLDQHREEHVPELAKAFLAIPFRSCQTIIAILAAGNCFARLIHVDNLRFAGSELEKLESIVSERKSAVLMEVDACKEKIRSMEEYQEYVEKVKRTRDIADFLKSLLDEKDSSQDPITGPDNKRVKFESFRGKRVLLIISDLKIYSDDIEILKSIHDKIKLSRTETETLYELVWIPIVDARPDHSEAPPNLFKFKMPWAVKVDPRRMNVLAPTYIKKEWGFWQETMVVVLDSLGRVENPDAMPMLRILQTFPFPSRRTESTHPRTNPFNWVQRVIKGPIVPHETLDAIETEYILFYRGTAAAATELDSDITRGIPRLSMVHIKDTKGFFIRLRSCLISRMEAVTTEINPLADPIVCDMGEAYEACQIGGFSILTKGRDLQTQHIGLFHTTSTLVSDLEWVRYEVTKDGGMDLAEAFKKKEPGVQELSGCKHAFVPQFPDLGSLCCPVCSERVTYDVSFTCCHSYSGRGCGQDGNSSTNATTE